MQNYAVAVFGIFLDKNRRLKCTFLNINSNINIRFVIVLIFEDKTTLTNIHFVFRNAF